MQGLGFRVWVFLLEFLRRGCRERPELTENSWLPTPANSRNLVYAVLYKSEFLDYHAFRLLMSINVLVYAKIH